MRSVYKKKKRAGKKSWRYVVICSAEKEEKNLKSPSSELQIFVGPFAAATGTDITLVPQGPTPSQASKGKT